MSSYVLLNHCYVQLNNEFQISLILSSYKGTKLQFYVISRNEPTDRDIFWKEQDKSTNAYSNDGKCAAFNSIFV
jgi:hypothetical protein